MLTNVIIPAFQKHPLRGAVQKVHGAGQARMGEF